MSDGSEIIVRWPNQIEMDQIYLAGFDVWADKKSKDEYLQDCRASSKYKQGQWWIADRGGQMVSSMIAYKSVFGLPPGSVGIGSVATPPELRRRGHASHMIKKYFETQHGNSNVIAFLFSEVNPVLYERLGFITLPTQLQKYPESLCMVKCDLKTLDGIKAGHINVPRYF